MKQEIKEEILSWVKAIAFGFVFMILLSNFVIVNASIPTGSMRNTIMEGDRIIAFRWAYSISEPERFDVIIFKAPDDESVYYVKRLIGLPGETVTIKNGEVFIDDSNVPIDSSFLAEKPFSEDFGPYIVPEDCYFMLGDNRNNSSDSRYWNNTYLTKEGILGKAIFRYYPSIGSVQ